MMRLMIRPMMGRPEAAARAQIDPCIYWNEWPDQLALKLRHVVPAEWDFTDRARRVAAPVLIVHGTADPNAAVEGGRAWSELIPGARLVEIEGVGHGPWLEAPNEFFGALEAFLREG
jgi:pimeloyl-ACP methyl ester carboxylesterase